jgi:RNA polymerase sigma-70 factor (ECF subfamily)
MSARLRHSRPSAGDVFEILARQHADMLTAFLRSLVTRSDVVDDLFQETMLVAWRRLDEYDRSRPFGPWLRGIAVRLVLAQRRRSAQDVLNCEPAVLEALEGRMRGFERIPTDTFRQRILRLRACMDKLPDRMRDVIDLGYGRGLLLREIAAALDAGVEAVKKRMQRARQLLMSCMQVPGDAP